MPLLCVFFLSGSEASKHISVKGIRYSTYKSHTRVVLDMDGAVEYTQNRIAQPDRLYFDLSNCSVSKRAKAPLAINDGTLKMVRISQFNKNNVRLVLELDRMDKFSSFMLEHPNRLVIDVYNPGQPVSTIKPGKGIKKKPVRKNFNKIRTVVIDPGHGGKDPGAVGPGGLQEKDITLYVAKKLGKIIRKKHNVDIIYTRNRDVFVPLNDRTEIANSKKADLFISIHVNASKKRSARGIETYFLNWTNNREAMRVAARENKITVKKMKKVQDGLQMILQDLARNNKREESMRLAHSVQSAMVNTLKTKYSKIEDLGVKYALFYVLVGAEMPSILVEVSFISNRAEEKRLARTTYRNKIAEAIAKGINSYINESTLIVKSDGESLHDG